MVGLDTAKTRISYLVHRAKVSTLNPGPDGVSESSKRIHAIEIATAGKEIVTTLLDAGAAKIDFRNQYGESLLHSAVLHGDVVLAKALIAGGANVLAANIHGEIPLHWAAREGHTEIAEALVQAMPGSEQTKNNEGQTPLDLHKLRSEKLRGAEDRKREEERKPAPEQAEPRKPLLDEDVPAYNTRLASTRKKNSGRGGGRARLPASVGR